MLTALDHALRYASQGLPVFPVWPALEFKPGRFVCGCPSGLRCRHPAKHPLGSLARNGRNDATIDEAKIRDWWTVWPNANISIATGNGLVVVDIDPRHGGDVTLAELEAKHGKLPQSWRVKTGGNGTHIYFRAPADIIIKDDSSGRMLGKGIDIKGQTGSAVAPPSNHESGGIYKWDKESGELAAMPDWLVAALATPAAAEKAASGPETWRGLVRKGLTDGQRNEEVTRLAGHLLRRYVDPIVVLELMLAFNDARGRPPLTPDEVTETVNKIAKRELKRRQSSS